MGASMYASNGLVAYSHGSYESHRLKAKFYKSHYNQIRAFKCLKIIYTGRKQV